MNEEKFRTLCQAKIGEYLRKKLHLTADQLSNDDIYQVWVCKTLQNSKGLYASPLNDGMYFEATYNGDKGQLYLDCYEKEANIEFNI